MARISLWLNTHELRPRVSEHFHTDGSFVKSKFWSLPAEFHGYFHKNQLPRNTLAATWFYVEKMTEDRLDPKNSMEVDQLNEWVTVMLPVLPFHMGVAVRAWGHAVNIKYIRNLQTVSVAYPRALREVMLEALCNRVAKARSEEHV